MAGSWNNPELEKAFNDIMDTFSGTETIRFVKFMYLVQNLDKQSKAGDKAAEQLLDLVYKFDRFTKVGMKP